MYYFVADIHIRPHQVGERQCFIAWLADAKEQAERIYILGDLFEYWYTGLESVAADLLAALDDPRVFILPGNRDFLLTNLKQVNLIKDEHWLQEFGGRRVILAHGHTLPQADYGFKCLHALGWPLLRLLDRLVSPARKNRWAEGLVRSSAVVRPLQAVISSDRALKLGADLIICGHLHRKVEQEHLMVLPAFQDRGEYLVWDESGFSWR